MSNSLNMPNIANQIPVGTGSDTYTSIAAVNNGVLVTDNSGVPSLLANSGTPGYVLTANSGAPPSWQASIGGTRPAFSAFLSTDVANATGDGTVVSPIPFDSTSYNVGSNFNTSTFTFTAPVSGIYCFITMIGLTGLTSSHTVIQPRLLFSINPAIDQLQLNAGTVRDLNTNLTISSTSLVSLALNETVTLSIAVYNGTKVVSLTGGTGGGEQYTFSGYLVG